MGQILVDGHNIRELNHEWGSRPEPFWTQEFLHAARFRKEHNGDLPDTTFWHWLEIRHDIAPKRFDHWHPCAGRWIEREECLEHTTKPPWLPHTPPPGGSGSTPEPSSFILIAVAFVAIGLLRLARWKSPRAPAC